MIQRKVDLIVLEGMGRAVHTNYYANFNCECLKVIYHNMLHHLIQTCCIINTLTINHLIFISKVAVLKNRWLAKRLGGEMFAVVFKYEVPGRQTHCIE